MFFQSILPSVKLFDEKRKVEGGIVKIYQTDSSSLGRSVKTDKQISPVI